MKLISQTQMSPTSLGRQLLVFQKVLCAIFTWHHFIQNLVAVAFKKAFLGVFVNS